VVEDDHVDAERAEVFRDTCDLGRLPGSLHPLERKEEAT
jgi:hypothetical protein